MKDNAVQTLKEQLGIRFELRAIDSDGDVIAKYTSMQSADDVIGFAGLIDDYVENYLVEYSRNDEEHRRDMDAEAHMQEALERRLA